MLQKRHQHLMLMYYKEQHKELCKYISKLGKRDDWKRTITKRLQQLTSEKAIDLFLEMEVEVYHQNLQSDVVWDFQSHGIATEIKGCCTYNNRRGTKHMCSLLPHSKIKKENACKNTRNYSKNCHLNLTCVLAVYQIGIGQRSVE